MKRKEKPFWETKTNPITGFKVNRHDWKAKDKEVKRKYNEKYRNKNQTQSDED